jgi:ketosteroid isomerase-like protein
MEPFVALMRRYCIDYTNSHDQSVCDAIMHPDYVVHISQANLPRDLLYKPAVRGVFERFPGLGLVVHEFVTNGDRLAMRFSEHGAAPAEGGRYAAWGGIGVYRWNGEQLLENFVEQDFLAQQAQLSGSAPPAPLEPPHLDPWIGTSAEPARPETEKIAREWLERGELRDAPEVVVDSSWYEALAPSPLAVESVVINDLFSAGDRVAFHVSQNGRYTGGLPGVDASREGETARLDCAGLARVMDGRVQSARVVTDRLGTARVMLQGA